MKCMECPLCVSDYCDACGDGDIYCLITRRYAKDEGGCRRTNKFILSQDRQKLKEEWAEDEAKKWVEFASYYDKSPDPLWCEDCQHFKNYPYAMSGEGYCDIDKHDTWYGCPICEKYEKKGAKQNDR